MPSILKHIFLLLVFGLATTIGNTQSCSDPNGTPCDDSNACTENDVCFNGVCQGTPIICNDNNPCTTDNCVNGICEYTPIANGSACNDGDPCTQNDQCIDGVCAGTLIDCDDGNPCTFDECMPGVGCVNTPLADGTACDDGSICTEGDQCVSGDCQGTMIICPDDGDPCTDEVCAPEIGCMSVPASGAPCDDGDPCTENDVCNNGVCAGTPIICNDNNPCTTDICVNGICEYAPIANGSACNDGNPCTQNDQCIDGVCAGTPIDCDDGNPCTFDECIPGIGCVNTPLADGTACDDGSICTEGDQCVNGACQGTMVICPDDGDPCTDEVCVPEIGCMSVPASGAPCDDGDPCTENDVCFNGVCQGTPIMCNDDNPCTSDECVNGVCVFTPLANGTACDDGDMCTTNDQCIDGVCQGMPIDCDDGDPCTMDDCFSDQGCVYTPIDSGVKVVTNNNPSGAGSLKNALNNACPNDTIVFTSGLDTIHLNQGLQVGNDSIVIIGNGNSSTIISGQGANRIFGVQSGVNFFLTDIRLVNGFASNNGGAIYNLGTLTLDEVVFENNYENQTPKAFTNGGVVIFLQGNHQINNE